MGEPATPTPAERAEVHAHANDVVEASRNDEEQPQARYPDGDAMSDDELIFRLSRELVDHRRTLVLACIALVGYCVDDGYCKFCGASSRQRAVPIAHEDTCVLAHWPAAPNVDLDPMQ